jgi:hypothetical protein
MTKAPVTLTHAAVYQRINRLLRKQGCILRRGKGRLDKVNNGEWYVLDRQHNTVPRQQVDLVALAQELGLLKPWETVGGGEEDEG